MAFASDSTTAPARPLLPLRGPDGRFAKRQALAPAVAERAELPPEPLLPAADLGRAIHLRRQLEAAAEHGAELLAALGLPRLVGPDTIVVDPEAAGDALDAAIAALDALDGDTDLEGGPDDEAEPDEDDGISEPTLGAPERHPELVSLGLSYYDRADGVRPRRIRPYAGQTTWAQGSRLDGEGEPEAGYDLPELDMSELDDDGIWRGEDDESEREQDLGAPAGDGDQNHWAQGDSRGYEDVTDGDGQAPAEWYKRPVGPGARPDFNGSRLDSERRAVRRQAEDARRRVKGAPPRRDPDLLIMAGPGRAVWRFHPLTRSGVEIVGTASA